jgi:hypothetical protein
VGDYQGRKESAVSANGGTPKSANGTAPGGTYNTNGSGTPKGANTTINGGSGTPKGAGTTGLSAGTPKGMDAGPQISANPDNRGSVAIQIQTPQMRSLEQSARALRTRIVRFVWGSIFFSITWFITLIIGLITLDGTFAQQLWSFIIFRWFEAGWCALMLATFWPQPGVIGSSGSHTGDGISNVGGQPKSAGHLSMGNNELGGVSIGANNASQGRMNGGASANPPQVDTSAANNSTGQAAALTPPKKAW